MWALPAAGSLPAMKGSRGKGQTMTATTRTYPWRFYIGPDGVVRACERCTTDEIEVALERLHLSERLKAPAPVATIAQILTAPAVRPVQRLAV
jgi:hypothetical protein